MIRLFSQLPTKLIGLISKIPDSQPSAQPHAGTHQFDKRLLYGATGRRRTTRPQGMTYPHRPVMGLQADTAPQRHTHLKSELTTCKAGLAQHTGFSTLLAAHVSVLHKAYMHALRQQLAQQAAAATRQLAQQAAAATRQLAAAECATRRAQTQVQALQIIVVTQHRQMADKDATIAAQQHELVALRQQLADSKRTEEDAQQLAMQAQASQAAVAAAKQQLVVVAQAAGNLQHERDLAVAVAQRAHTVAVTAQRRLRAVRGKAAVACSRLRITVRRQHCVMAALQRRHHYVTQGLCVMVHEATQQLVAARQHIVDTVVVLQTHLGLTLTSAVSPQHATQSNCQQPSIHGTVYDAYMPGLTATAATTTADNQPLPLQPSLSSSVLLGSPILTSSALSCHSLPFPLVTSSPTTRHSRPSPSHSISAAASSAGSEFPSPMLPLPPLHLLPAIQPAFTGATSMSDAESDSPWLPLPPCQQLQAPIQVPNTVSPPPAYDEVSSLASPTARLLLNPGAATAASAMARQCRAARSQSCGGRHLLQSVAALLGPRSMGGCAPAFDMCVVRAEHGLVRLNRKTVDV